MDFRYNVILQNCGMVMRHSGLQFPSSMDFRYSMIFELWHGHSLQHNIFSFLAWTFAGIDTNSHYFVHLFDGKRT